MSTQVGYYEAWRDLMRSWDFQIHETSGWHQRDAQPSSIYLPGRLYLEHHDASTLLSGNWGALPYIVSRRLSNIVTARDGQVMLVAAGVTWHAGVGGPVFDIGRNDANVNSLGNEVANSGREPYSDGCTRAVIATEAAWAIVSGRADEVQRIIGHKEWATPLGRKVDPAVDMHARRAAVAAFIAEKTSKPAPPQTPTEHVVRPGDTLWAISRTYSVSVGQLREWNHLTSDLIEPGQRLRVIPGVPPPPPPPKPTIPPVPGLPRWPLPRGHYYGHIAGPAASHGGYHRSERDEVMAIQRRFIASGCVPGITDWRSGWADGRWEDATTAACRRWFARYRPGQRFTTRIYSDDYRVLARTP